MSSESILILDPGIKPADSLQIRTLLGESLLLVGEICPHGKTMLSVGVKRGLVGLIILFEDRLDVGPVFWCTGSVKVAERNADWARYRFPLICQRVRWMSSETSVKSSTFRQKTGNVFTAKAIAL